ncbi:MAG: hypothetical protein ACD_19C00426G0105 [uncultured bacterium]|nr:MAG: hypothetical protein ACD_19C00426G0105 [uncultured bacterium]
MEISEIILEAINTLRVNKMRTDFQPIEALRYE